MILPKKKRQSYALQELPPDWPRKQEAKVSKRMDAVLQPASGATPFLKGDLMKGDYVIDMKSTQNVAITITVSMLEKAEQFGIRQTKKPALLLNFVKAKTLRHKRWLLIPMED